MIAYVKGIAEEQTENSVIVEAGGIGYEIYMTAAALSRISTGKEIKIYTWFQVREDGMALFGFLNKDDLGVFRLLIGISGIGPKAALGVLGALNADELRFAVLSDDVKSLLKAPGIGKKTAQKMILELKDKFSLEEAFENKYESTVSGEASGAEGAAGSGISTARKEAIEALAALGYNSTDAMKAVKSVDEAITDVEEILKAALHAF